MKITIKHLFIGICIISALSGCKDNRPTIEKKDDLELAHVCLNRVFTLEDNSKVLWIFDKAGKRLATYRTGPYVITAYITLGDIEIISHDENGYNDITLICPEIKIKGQYEKWEERKLRYERIDQDEGRKPFSANEILHAEEKAVNDMAQIIEDKDNNPIIQELIDEARRSARENIPLLLKNYGNKDRVIIKFKDDKNEE